MENSGKTAVFPWPDWGNTAWVDMAGLGSIGLNMNTFGHQKSIETNRQKCTVQNAGLPYLRLQQHLCIGLQHLHVVKV